MAFLEHLELSLDDFKSYKNTFLGVLADSGPTRGRGKNSVSNSIIRGGT